MKDDDIYRGPSVPMTNPRHVVTSFPLGAILLVILFPSLPALAQQQQTLDEQPALSRTSSSSQSTAPQQQPAADKPADVDKDTGKTQNNGTSKDRLGFVLPNFLTVENAGKIPPLTAKQKFAVVARGSFDWAQYPWYGFLSGISQAENSEPGYGQGAEGYGKRYGAAWADGTIENFWTGAILPSLLRQDPRFYQKGKGGFWHRTGYAMSRIVVTRSDSGNNQFNFSEIFGSAISAGISTYSYHPRAEKTLRNTASVWGTQIGYDTLTLVVKEFWPDIRRKLRKKDN
ncbi:MAG TPA: hypothetical protein VNU23_07150 [Candidatus Cybelea sp.]|nr:hypothetical protein [Candidatus Cybelea sp.]